MPREMQKVWVTCTVIKRWFGIHPDTIESRGVVSRAAASATEYDMDDVIEKCGDLIARRFSGGSSDADPQARNAKDRLALARAVDAELDLSKKQKRLADVRTIQEGYEKGIAGLRDSILEIPNLMRRARPDIEPALLDIANTAIARGLNEAAKARQHGDDDT